MDENEHPSSAYSREDTAEQPQAGGAVTVDAPAIPEPPLPWIPAAPPGAPFSSGEGAWNFGKPAATSGLRRGRRSMAVALVVVLVAAAGAYALLNRRSSSGGTAFALTLSRDKTYSYDVRLGMRGTISMQGEQVPFRMEMDQVIGWRVESTDSEGTATVAVTVEIRAAQLNGQPAPAIPAQTSRIRVARDGRILSADFALSGLGTNRPGDFGSLVPGGDQFMPLLPNHPVKVGDTWTKAFDQELPFGMGRLRYDVESSLLRYGDIDGKRMAVLFSTLRLPLNMTIDLRKLLAASGTTGGQPLPGGGDPKMKFGGSMTMQQTAWFDQAHGELYLTTGIARFDMSIEFKDFPPQANPPAGAMNFKGTMELQVQRIGGAPTLSPKAKNAKAQADLRNALAAAKVRYASARTYRGFTPAAAGKLASSLAFNRSAKARVDQVSIRVATKTVLLLVTRSASGKVFCIAERRGKLTYGRRDARDAAGCHGGW
jgi:hypothetical protein